MPNYQQNVDNSSEDVCIFSLHQINTKILFHLVDWVCGLTEKEEEKPLQM